MARDPRAIVDQVRAQAHQIGPPDPPALLDHAVGSAPPLGSIRQTPEITEMHDAWLRIHGPDSSASGIRRRTMHRLGAASSDAEHAARELTGDLIRAVDVLAQRCDDLAARLSSLEELVEEVITVMAADLVAIRAALSTPAATNAAAQTRPGRRGRSDDGRGDE